MVSVKPYVLQDQWKIIRGRQLCSKAISILMASTSKSTNRQYTRFIDLFKDFCNKRGDLSHKNISLETGIQFLTELFEKGLSYSSLNIARSALSQYVSINNAEDNCDFGKHPLTVKFMKGVFKLRPPKCRYSFTWDVKIVLDFLRLKINRTISLKELTLKCVMLIALCTGQRAQTLAAIDLDNLVTDSQGNMVFTFDKILKTSRPGFKTFVEICQFERDTEICPLNCLNQYIECTRTLRKTSKLFISFQKPHHGVSSQTISRWIVLCLREAKVPDIFSGHSTRSAASSKAALSVDSNTILSSVGWANEKTFASYYKREIRRSQTARFTEAVLS